MRHVHDLVCALGFGLVVAGLGSMLPTRGHLSPLSAERLNTAAGASKQFHVTKVQSCNEETAALYLSSTVVGGEDCNAGNSGGGTNCIECTGSGTNMLTQMGSDGGPGIKFGQTYDCGEKWLGVCALVGGVPACTRTIDQDQVCASATEYWNQP